MPTRRSVQAIRDSASISRLRRRAAGSAPAASTPACERAHRADREPALAQVERQRRGDGVAEPVGDRDPEHHPRAAAAVEVVGKEVRRERRQDVLHRAVFVDVAGDAQRRQLAHLVGGGDRAAEDQQRQPARRRACGSPGRARRPPACGSRRSRTIRSTGRGRRARAPAARRRSSPATRVWPAPRAPWRSGRARTPCRRRRDGLGRWSRWWSHRTLTRIGTGPCRRVRSIAEFSGSRYNPKLSRSARMVRSTEPTVMRLDPPGACMATCPECDAEIEVDEFDVDKGDLISCPDCGSNLEVTSTSPLELEIADDEDDDDDDDDDDEDDDEEDEDDDDDDDEDDERGLGRVTATRRPVRGARRRSRARSKEAALYARSPTSRPDRRLQRRRRQRATWPTPPPGARHPRALRHRRQPQLSRAPSRSWRSAIARRVRLAARDHQHRRDGASRVPRQPGQPLLLLQARALHAPDGDRARARHSRDRRRQQRRRSRRLPARPPGGARVRRAQPARRSRSSPRTRSASCRARPGCRPGTSRRRPACRRAFRISAKSPTRSCG